MAAAFSEEGGIGRNPRRYKVKAPGVVVREGVELESAKVGEVATGREVVAVGETKASSSGVLRVSLVLPLKGWVSVKKLEVYGTGHAVPQVLEQEEKKVETPRRKIKVGAKKSTMKHKEHKDPPEGQDYYKVEDPYEKWVMENENGKDPKSADVRASYAEALLASGETGQARAEAEAVLVQAPLNEKARAVYVAAAKVPSKPLSKEAEWARLKAEADAEFGDKKNWRSAATLYLALLDAYYRDATAEAAPARTLDGGVVVAPKVEACDARAAARLHANCCACFCKLKRWDEATYHGKLAVRCDPNWDKAYRRLSAAYEGAGQFVKAMFELKNRGLRYQAEERGVERAERVAMDVFEKESEAVMNAGIMAETIELEDLAGEHEMDEPLDAAPAEIRKKTLQDRAGKQRSTSAAAYKKLLKAAGDSDASSESSLSDLDEGDDDDKVEAAFEAERRDRGEAAYAAKRARAALVKQENEETLARVPHDADDGTRLDPAKAERVVVSKSGLRVQQAEVMKEGACLATVPVGDAQTWCVTILEQGIGCVLGVAAPGAALSTSMARDPRAWSLDNNAGKAASAVARGKPTGLDMREFETGDTVGLLIEGSRLDVYVNGALRRRGVFTDVERPCFAFIAFKAPTHAGLGFLSGDARFVAGRLVDQVKIAQDAARLQLRGGRAKNHRLVDADGKPHERENRRKNAFCMRTIHEKGDGAPNAVWCETHQARWTQSVESITVVALQKPRGVQAADCDVTIAVRYLKAAHRATGEVWLEGQLDRDVLPLESLWYVDDEGHDLIIVLAKSLAHLHRGAIADGNWHKLFDYDDALSDDDMEDDRTDLDPARKRQERIAQMKGREQCKFEQAKRQAVEDQGLSWTWTNSPDDPFAPSYMVPNQIGYDVPCDRQRAIEQAGLLTGA